LTSEGTKHGPKRNKGFDATHDLIVTAAASLISQKGVDALSMAAVARAVGINRTTLYYHFDDREALLAAVKSWSSEQLGRGFSPQAPQRDRIDHITRFVLENAEVIKLWLDDFISPGNIRERYPHWEQLIDGMANKSGMPEDDVIDPEVYCTILLTAAFIAPRVYHQSVRPDLSPEAVIEKFRHEHQRTLRRDGMSSE